MHPIDQQLDHMLRGEFEKGWQISEHLERNGPDNIPVVPGKDKEEMWLRHNFNRGWFLLNQGKFQEGMQLLDSGRFLNVYGGPPLATSKPIWDGSDPSGKTIIISLEGGYGDEIIHARFAKTLADKGANVILAADPQLHSLFYRIPGVSKCITRIDAKNTPHDYWIPGFSVAWVAGITFETLPNDPYIFPNPTSVEMWKNIISSEKIKIGIRWSGNPKFEHQQFRKFPPELLIDLANRDEFQIYSLQRDNDIQKLPENIIDLQHLLISWEDTAAAISNLDLVITSCTSIAHISAAMGKETWVIVPILPYHTWTLDAPHSTSSPWYKSALLFRQEEYQDWTKCFNKLYKKLNEKFNLTPPISEVIKKPKSTLNLGCGFKKIEGALNVDKEPLAQPDKIVDLEVFPWPFDDNSFDVIVAKDILEHLGQTPSDFINILKEMYRISKPNATWEVVFPHWRCDNAINDPTHVRLLTTEMFKLFDQSENALQIKKQTANSTTLGLYNNIDIQIIDSTYEIVDYWKKQLDTGTLSSQEFEIKFNTLNNVATAVNLVIKVHKPGREIDLIKKLLHGH